MNVKRIPIMTALFFGLYVAVSVATFRHSAHGFASIEGGSFWWGALSATAVDVGMILSASYLRKQRNFWVIGALIITAGASTYTQWLYAVSSASVVTVAPGAVWLGDTATQLIDLRIVLLPALLPTLAVFYAFAAKTGDDKEPALREEVNAILALRLGKEETARRIWQLSDNGRGAFTAPYVAQLAQCGVRTAQKAKLE
jgi:hypothetical protein